MSTAVPDIRRSSPVSTAKQIPEPLLGAPMKRRRWGLMVLTVLMTVVAASGAWYLRTKGTKASVDKAGAPQDSAPGTGLAEPVPVETVRLSTGGIVRTSSQIGSIEAFEAADLFAKISGYLKELY